MKRKADERNGGNRTSDETWSDKLSRIRRKASRLAEKHGLQEGYRSGLEFTVGKALADKKIDFRFEDPQDIMVWTPLPTKHKYHPDFVIPRGPGKPILIIETKGRFMPDDMAKHLALKEQHPELEVRFVFQKPKAWYRKAVKMNYALWCDKNGFKYCGMKEFDKVIGEWINE